MTAFRKGKNGGTAFEEGARAAKPKNAVGFRLVQRKFAQGAPLPPPQPMAASPAPERRPEPPKEDQRVHHSHMSAMNLLDVIALQKVHAHPTPGGQQPQQAQQPPQPQQPQQPKVMLERLRRDELPGPSAPVPPASPPPPPARQEQNRRVVKTMKFKKRMCLRPRPGMSRQPEPARTKFKPNMHRRVIRPGVVRSVRLSTVSSTVSTATATEDDVPLLFLMREPTAEDVELATDTESNSNFDFIRPVRPCAFMTNRNRSRRTREVTPMPRLMLQASERVPGQPRRSARRPCPRSFPVPPQRPRNRRDYPVLDPIGLGASEEGSEPLVNFANRLHPKCCSTSAYTSVQNVVMANTARSILLSRRCRKCDRCDIIQKIIKLSGLVQAAYRRRVSANDSNYYGNRSSQPFGQMLVTRPGHTEAWVYLDIFPRPFPKGLKVEYKPAGSDTMEATVYVVDRWTMMDTSEVSFMEQQNLVGSLLGYMEKQVEDHGVQHENGIREPRPSTSRANAGSERIRDPKRKRVVSTLNQNSQARRQPRVRKVNANARRPGSPFLKGHKQVNIQTQTTDTEGASGQTAAAAVKNPLSRIKEAPRFCPSKEEFEDPIAYFKTLEEKAAPFGICKVVPPETFKPPCKLLGNNRFSVVYQYISKLYNRWGPGSRELAAIKAYLWLQNFTIRRPPIMECSEINLPKLHHVVERYGGANKVVKYKRWTRVAEEMNLRQVRTSERRLDQVFIQYLLPYASLSLDERQKKIASVENGWTKKYQRIVKKAHKPFHKQERLLGEAVSSEEETELPEVVVALREAEDCIVPGRAMNLTVFKKVAETLRDNHFDRGAEHSIDDIEVAYWRAVMQGDDHIVANAASIDTGDEGYGFPKDENDGYSQHPYNLKMIAKHPDNVLRFLGDLLGANNPTLHLNMLFSTSCWHRDPHRLPWIEYLHKGEPKIWYGIPDSESENFRRAVQRLCPAFCQNKPIWLASDIAMIPPDTLMHHNVELTRTVQMPGEYILVFPKAHSCSFSTGFSVSESVYFATLDWLESAPTLFKGLRDSCEPSMFSLEQLLINGVSDTNTPRHLLLPMCSVLSTLISDELENRRLLALKGLKIDEPLPPKRGPSRRGWNNAPECEFCRCTLFLSGVVGLTGKRGAFCTEHALKLLDCGKYTHIEVPELEFRSNFKNVDLEQIIKNTETRVVEGV